MPVASSTPSGTASRKPESTVINEIRKCVPNSETFSTIQTKILAGEGSSHLGISLATQIHCQNPNSSAKTNTGASTPRIF